MVPPRAASVPLPPNHLRRHAVHKRLPVLLSPQAPVLEGAFNKHRREVRRAAHLDVRQPQQRPRP